MQFTASISEPVLRLSVFAAVFVAMALLELAMPKRDLSQPRQRRWTTNLAIVGIDSLLVRAMEFLPRLLGGVIMPLAAVAMALWARGERHRAVQLRSTGRSGWKVVIALLVLDFAIWLQHLASHKIADASGGCIRCITPTATST